MSRVKPLFKALVVGFYGAPNVGDEALLDLLIRRIRELGGEPVVVSIDPPLTRRMHEVDTVAFNNIGALGRALLGCDVLVMGGGGIFQDHHAFNVEAVYLPFARDISDYARPMLLARQLGVPTIVWAHGVGPLRDVGARALVSDLFQHATVVSVRDEASKSLLQEIGVDRDIRVAADPAWMFRRYHSLPSLDAVHAESPAASQKVLAVVVREWDKGQWKHSLVEALRSVPDEWRIVWVAFQANTEGSQAISDLPVIQDLRDQLGDRAGDVLTPDTPEQAWKVLAGADAVLSMRLHASILALLAGKPTAGIEYDAKLAHAHAMVGMPNAQRLSVTADIDSFRQAIHALLARNSWIPDAQVLQSLESSAETHFAMLDICADLPPKKVSFDAGHTDWVLLWLRQALAELEQVREDSQRAHDLLLYRDQQLAGYTGEINMLLKQNTDVNDVSDERPVTMSDVTTFVGQLQHQLDENAQRLQQALEELAHKQASLDDKETSISQLQQQLAACTQTMQQMTDDLARTQAYIDEKEVYIAQLREQERLNMSKTPALLGRMRKVAGGVRRTAARAIAAPFKVATVWRNHGLKMTLRLVARRLRTLGDAPTSMPESVEQALPELIRHVRDERLLVLASSVSDTDGWPSRAMQFTKAADRAGFFARLTVPVEQQMLSHAENNAWLCVNENAWLQEVRAEGTRVLVADASAQALALAASARERGAEIIVDLGSLGLETLTPALRKLADRVITDRQGGVSDDLPTQYIGEAGDNEIFDSYRAYPPVDAYMSDKQNVLFICLGGNAEGWLDATLQATPNVVAHVVGMNVDARDPSRVQARPWSWQPDVMAPLIAGAQSVVIVGGAAHPERLAHVCMASLLLEKPVFVDHLPEISASPNLHHVELAQLSERVASTSGVEDYAFISRNAWLGQAERLMKPAYPTSVSVVVLIYNNRRIIERCVSTLLEHAGEWLQEIVVVDNQSSDGGAELVESLYGGHPKVKLVRNVENGCSSGRNLGAKHSTGRYIAFFDSDQWVTSPSCFAEAVSILSSNKNMGTIGWNAGWFDPLRDDLGGPISDYLPNRGMNAEAKIKGYRDDVGFLGTSCMFVSRELFDRLDGFDTFYDPTCFEDTDICFQIKKAGYSVAFRDLAGVRHQPHQTTGASAGSERYVRLFNRNSAYFREKWKAYPEFFSALKSWH